MNIMLSKHKIQGIGLIEVLISIVVIAVGLLALASMQGKLLSGSADNKTRAEAQVLAEQKIEELKNLMKLSDFNAGNLTGGEHTSEPPIGGINETFSRSWTIVDKGDRKEITVTVAWGGESDDETLSLTNEIVFLNPPASANLAQYGGAGGRGLAPNPNQNASESIEDTVDLFDGDGNDAANLLTGVTTADDGLYSFGGNKYRDDGNDKTGSLVVVCSTNLDEFDIDLTYPGNYPGTYTESTGVFASSTTSTNRAYLYTKRFVKDGVEVIELYSQHYTPIITGQTITGYNLYDWCVAEHRYFGGIIIPIKGRVRTEFNLDDIKIDHNKEDMYCTFYPGDDLSDQPYTCYVGGNCDLTTGTTVRDPDATTCSVTADTVRKEGVGPGGFSGNVGLVNVDDHGGGKESVCFKDDLDGTSTDFFSARKYKTIQSTAGRKEEGINAPYVCQDFYIVGRQANVNKLSAKCSAESGTVNLPPQELIRTISGNNEVETSVNDDFCTPRTIETYTFTVAVTGTPDLDAVITGSGVVCTGSASPYTCVVTTAGTSMLIYASNSTQSGSCLISDLTDLTSDGAPTPRSCDSTTTDTDGNSVTVPDDSGRITLQTPPAYTLSGTIDPALSSGGYTMDVTADSFIGSPVCSFTDSTFTCNISTFESSVRMEISKGKTSDSCNKNDLFGTVDESFPDVCALNPVK